MVADRRRTGSKIAAQKRSKIRGKPTTRFKPTNKPPSIPIRSHRRTKHRSNMQRP